MQKGKEWIDEREGALMCFTFSFFFFFCMNGISQEGNCLVCEVTTSIQGNYEHAWLPKEGM